MASIVCGSCHQRLECQRIEEGNGETCLGKFECSKCNVWMGVDAIPVMLSSFINRVTWTDEAAHVLDRLPYYVVPFVREEVEEYAQGKGINPITFAVIAEAKNRGSVVWDQDAERRLERVPAAVRAIARVELERTAIDRGMPEVTVSLMEEVKARYFGMGAAK